MLIGRLVHLVDNCFTGLASNPIPRDNKTPASKKRLYLAGGFLYQIYRRVHQNSIYLDNRKPSIILEFPFLDNVVMLS